MRPLVISHAACAGHAPENTLAGVRAALELGVDAIEVDVHVTADGIPVLMHDPTVDRTTNGRGSVASLTLEQIRALDAGGEPVPTLAEALELARSGALLIAEIKAPGIEGAVAEAVRRAGALAEVMVWSFFPHVLTAMREAEPRLPCALLLTGEALARWSEMRELAVRLGAQGVSVFHQGLEAPIVRGARRSALAVYAWTADSGPEIERLLALGVDGIVSNYPERVLAALSR